MLRTSPKCHRELVPLPGGILFSLDVSDVSLDVDLNRNGRVKSKGKDKVMRRQGTDGQRRVQLFAVSSLKISRRERDLGGVAGV